jgi:plastocyanin
MKRLPGSLRARLATVSILAVAALAVVAFGGASAGASSTKAVGIANFKFQPGTLRVKAGTRVAFTNNSRVTHTATKAGAFDTGDIRPGRSILVKFTKPGTFAYHCTIHPFMHGTIVVE